MNLQREPVLLALEHFSPRHFRRVQCLTERVPETVVLQVAGGVRVYPWWREQPVPGGLRVVRLFDAQLEDIEQPQAARAARFLLEKEYPRVAIVGGYSSPLMRFIARWVHQRGGKTILLCVSWHGDRRRWLLKEWIKGLLVRRLFDAVLVAGERSYAYCRSLGFRESQIWKQFNVVDNEHFRNGSEVARQNSANLLRGLGLSEHHFLFVGALEPWKNIPLLLQAYARYRVGGGRWGLVLVGVGSEMSVLHEMVQRQAIPEVVFAGMKTHAETPLHYGLASCLVLPSLSEAWGLVVNEAEAAGLPVLASNKCGCVPELVHRGINGYVFEPTDCQELIRLLHLVSGGSVNLLAMGASSRQIISYYTPERWADAAADCVRHLLAR